MAPHVDALSTCDSFRNCMMTNELFRLGATSGDGGQIDVISVMRTMYAKLTDTDFWCRSVTLTLGWWVGVGVGVLVDEDFGGSGGGGGWGGGEGV